MPSSRTPPVQVSGVAMLPPDAAVGQGVVHVLVEDVSRSDAAALVVGRCDLPAVSLAAGASLPFAVEVPAFEPTRHYSVRVHVDRSGNGSIEPGDQISTQSHPVLTQGHPSHVRVSLSSV